MSSPEQKKCNQCLQVFCKAKNPLKMPNCKHNICQQCLQQIRQAKLESLQCQFCNTTPVKIQNKKFQTNKTLISKLKERKQWILKVQETNNSINTSTKAENQSHQFLLSDQQGSNKKQSLPKAKKQNDFCVQHQKAFEIICITDLKMICPHCAIFGNHKDHCFKTLKQFNKDYEQNYQKVQIIKQQKYLYEKKLKNVKNNDNIQQVINQRKSQIRAQISKLIEKMIKDLQNLQVTISQQLNKQFNEIFKDIQSLFQQNKIQEEFLKWQANCQNYLSSVDKSQGIDQKVKIFYGSQKILGCGQQIVDKLEKKLQFNTKKLQMFIDSIKIQVKEQLDINKLIRISKKQQDAKKDNFMLMIQKINLPGGKHVFQQNGDIHQNSFMTDYSKQDFSLILQAQGKKTGRSTVSKKNTIKPSLVSSAKFRSPTKRLQTQTLIRHKSNGHIGTQSQLKMNTSELYQIQNSTIKIEIKDPSAIVKDFIKHDLKQVLDLSRCQLNDQSVKIYLKQVRKCRKIRGLKLCHNQITDIGFQNILQYLGSTTNLNLSHNKLTQQTLSLIIKNRDQISPLRIVNFSSNNLNEKKSKTRIDALKKMGIIINI